MLQSNPIGPQGAVSVMKLGNGKWSIRVSITGYSRHRLALGHQREFECIGVGLCVWDKQHSGNVLSQTITLSD